MKHKIEIGGAPCPTCGFKINSRKASRPFVIEDDSMETVECEVGHTQNAEQFLSDVADHLKVQSRPSDGGVAVNMPFERLPQHASDPGYGPVPRDGGVAGEPVAWQMRPRGSFWQHCDIVTNDPDIEFRPLYALPPVTGNEGREAIIEKCARIAEHGCLVQPDGGSPTVEEKEMCDGIARAIRGLSHSRSYRQTPDQNQKPRCGNCNLLEPCDDMHCPNGGSGA